MLDCETRARLVYRRARSYAVVHLKRLRYPNSKAPGENLVSEAPDYLYELKNPTRGPPLARRRCSDLDRKSTRFANQSCVKSTGFQDLSAQRISEDLGLPGASILSGEHVASTWRRARGEHVAGRSKGGGMGKGPPTSVFKSS
jgi:hypothetical protein